MRIEEVCKKFRELRRNLNRLRGLLCKLHDFKMMSGDLESISDKKYLRRIRNALVEMKESVLKTTQWLVDETDTAIKWIDEHIKD